MSAVLEARELSARYLEAVQPALLQQFELLATASGGVVRLRELILSLAVRGHLVRQDPGDEPATELVARIFKQKEALICAGIIKRDRPLLPIEPEDVPFDIPKAWCWIRLGGITNYGAPKKAGELAPNTWVLDLEDIEKSTGRLVHRARRAERPALSDKNAFELGDVLYGKLRPYLNKVLVADEPGVCTTELIPFRCFGDWNPGYFKVALSSPMFLEYVNARSYGMKMPQLGTDDARNAVLPLPPLPEQARIVARVDELMRLCEALEAQGRLEAEQHARLLGTLLGTLTDSSTPEELAANWQRVADHFDLLLDRPEAVDALEQTLLQLAVRGLLVPQDSNQEPGVKNSHRSLTTAEEPIGEAELPFDVPANWRWVRLGSQAELINGDRGKNYPNRAEYVVTGVPFINTGHIEPDGTLSQDSMHHLTRAKFESLRSGKTRSGDLVYCLRGATLGKTAIVEYPEGAIASSLVILRFKESVNRKFAYLFLTSPFGRELIRRFDNGSAQPNLAASSVARYVMPLPPLEEQSRIVARAAELRRLCADLRQRLAASQTTQSHLAEALVDTAVA